MKKSGAWYTYDGEQLGQGRENSKTFLTENPEVMMEISDKVMIAAGLKPDPNAPIEPADQADEFTEEHDQPISLD